MVYTDSLTMGSSQDTHLWMVYGYICRNGNSSARILLGVCIRIVPCRPHGRCGLTMGLGVERLKSMELKCQLCLLFDSTFSCSSTASPDVSLVCTLPSIPGPAQLSLVAACGAAAWIHELQCKEVDCSRFSSTCSYSTSESPISIACSSTNLQGCNLALSMWQLQLE